MGDDFQGEPSRVVEKEEFPDILKDEEKNYKKLRIKKLHALSTY